MEASNLDPYHEPAVQYALVELRCALFDFFSSDTAERAPVLVGPALLSVVRSLPDGLSLFEHFSQPSMVLPLSVSEIRARRSSLIAVAALQDRSVSLLAHAASVVHQGLHRLHVGPTAPDSRFVLSEYYLLSQSLVAACSIFHDLVRHARHVVEARFCLFNELGELLSLDPGWHRFDFGSQEMGEVEELIASTSIDLDNC
jgi:hypothetical protein